MPDGLNKSFVVFASIESDEHDHCVDLFQRPDGSFGFESFRADVEDQGLWTQTGYFSEETFASADAVYAAAEAAVPWLADVLKADPSHRKLPHKQG